MTVNELTWRDKIEESMIVITNCGITNETRLFPHSGVTISFDATAERVVIELPRGARMFTDYSRFRVA